MSSTRANPSVQDVNVLALFLASRELPALHPSVLEHHQIDCVTLVGSAILYCAESVFSALGTWTASHPLRTLVIAGGIGHSTPLLYDAVKLHPRYGPLFETRGLQMDGMPESRVLEVIGQQFYGLDRLQAEGLRFLVDDRSTNCGANAIETRRVLDEAGITPRGIAVVQDPTMSLRTKAAFEKTFADRKEEVRIWAWPSFVPRVAERRDGLIYEVEGFDDPHAQLWEMERFLDLLVGEVPRLRDDEGGYGPRGKGFIVHVHVPQEVEEAWRRIQERAGRRRIAA